MNDVLLESAIKNLKKNHFEVYLAENTTEAASIFFQEILPAIKPESVSWGDSETLRAVGCIEELARYPEISVIRTFGSEMSRDQKIYWRRQALLADLFLTGTNAVTQKGQLVNLDIVGNRVAGITFGPKHVVLFIGVNKIVSDLEAAMQRIRTRIAPQNVRRHEGFHTPCRETGTCMDCNSPCRICNTWTITEKSYPTGRIKIILIQEEGEEG